MTLALFLGHLWIALPPATLYAHLRGSDYGASMVVPAERLAHRPRGHTQLRGVFQRESALSRFLGRPGYSRYSFAGNGGGCVGRGLDDGAAPPIGVLMVGLVLVIVSWTVSITGLVRSLRSTVRPETLSPPSASTS